MSQLAMKVMLTVSLLIYVSKGMNAQLIHSQNFSVCNSVTWQVVSGSTDRDTRTWRCASVDNNGVMEVSPTIGEVSDDWLISPAINLDNTEEEYFIFDYHNGFEGPSIELYYSVDFAGEYTSTAVEAATWSLLDDSFLDYEYQNRLTQFSKHPAIPLHYINGDQVYFAFRYTTNGPTKRWRIDNIRIQDGYYQSAYQSSNTCASFKTELYNIIKDHREIPYTSSDYDVWDSQFTTDLRLDDAGQSEIVWDIYSDRPDEVEAYTHTLGADNHQGEDIFEEGEYYNREHVFAKSWWGGSREIAPYTDIHHIVPADAYVNTLKSAWPVGEITDVVETTTNGSAIGTYPQGNNEEYVFEPIDEYKGDVARMLFYMAVRYEDEIADWSKTFWGGQALLDDSYQVYQDWQMDILLRWNDLDPVSLKEVDRNNAVYSIQLNRNPFIDHPRWAYRIWGEPDGGACEAVVANDEISDDPISIQPNPASYTLNIDLDVDADYRIYSSMGDLIKSGRLDRQQLDISFLPAGIYYVMVQDGHITRRGRFIKL